MLHEMREHLAVAAAEVEHARAARHEAGDDVEVASLAHDDDPSRAGVRRCVPRGDGGPARGGPSLVPLDRFGANSLRDALEVRAHHAVIARVLEQERVVAVRRLDLGVRDLGAVVDQRLDDLARALRREAPVGGEAHDQEAAVACGGERGGEVAVVRVRGVEVVERAGDQQVGVGVEILAELVALVAQVALDLELDVVRRIAGGAGRAGRPVRASRGRTWPPSSRPTST